MKTALILVDIQNDYFPGGPMELVGMVGASAKARDLLRLFRKNRWTTVHVQHVSTNERSTFFLAHTHGAEIHEMVQPIQGELVVQKHFPNSFRKTLLNSELAKARIERIVICGAMSHMCIDATTRAGADLGFECMVIHDACSTRDLRFGGKIIRAHDVHGSFMAALDSAYAKVLSFSGFLSWVESASLE